VCVCVCVINEIPDVQNINKRNEKKRLGLRAKPLRGKSDGGAVVGRVDNARARHSKFYKIIPSSGRLHIHFSGGTCPRESVPGKREEQQKKEEEEGCSPLAASEPRTYV